MFNDLTEGLQLHILSFLDVPSLLRASCCSGSMIRVKNMNTVWVERFNSHWPGERLEDLHSDKSREFALAAIWRRPRVRIDGAYVCRCQYYRSIQEGSSLTDTRTSIPIVYHRIIRFLSDHTAYMLLSEKGSRHSARDVFNSRIREPFEVNRDRFGRQLTVCRWRLVGNKSVQFSYFDGKLSWSGRLAISAGSGPSRQPGRSMVWEDYRFWDPVEVAEWRRRELYRERERLQRDLRVAVTRPEESISDLLFQIDRLGDAMRTIAPDTEEGPEDVPGQLVRELKLNHEHFPIMRFGTSKHLAHLF
jgi:hypothetical protein